MNHARTVVLILTASASAAVYSAAVVDECPAEKYKQCVTFNTSRSIGDHTPLMENSLAGFIRSKGSWTLHVGYGPSATCAKVSLTVDMGPTDVHRTYERVFRNGKGVISDTGSFVHLVDDVESALQIMTSSCRIPDELDPERLDAEAQERRELEEERERLALQEERERLALEEERERVALEAERKRLALEAERKRLALEAERRRQEEERRLAQAQRAREQERERQRLARERQRMEEQRERMRLAELQRERERERLDEQRAFEEAEKLHSVVSFLGGVRAGLDSLNRGEGGAIAILRSGSAYARGLSSMENAASIARGSNPVVVGSFGGSCDQAQRRAEEMIAARTRSISNDMGMCSSARYFLRTMQDVRRELASGGCPAYALEEYDRTISQASQNVRASCD